MTGINIIHVYPFQVGFQPVWDDEPPVRRMNALGRHLAQCFLPKTYRADEVAKMEFYLVLMCKEQEIAGLDKMKERLIEQYSKDRVITMNWQQFVEDHGPQCDLPHHAHILISNEPSVLLRNSAWPNQRPGTAVMTQITI